MISDPLNYGLFPDDYSLVLLLDRCVNAGDWHSGARLAVYMMLQEETAVPIASEMALLCAYR